MTTAQGIEGEFAAATAAAARAIKAFVPPALPPLSGDPPPIPDARTEMAVDDEVLDAARAARLVRIVHASISPPGLRAFLVDQLRNTRVLTVSSGAVGAANDTGTSSDIGGVYYFDGPDAPARRLRGSLRAIRQTIAPAVEVYGARKTGAAVEMLSAGEADARIRRALADVAPVSDGGGVYYTGRLWLAGADADSPVGLSFAPDGPLTGAVVSSMVDVDPPSGSLRPFASLLVWVRGGPAAAQNTDRAAQAARQLDIRRARRRLVAHSAYLIRTRGRSLVLDAHMAVDRGVMTDRASGAWLSAYTRGGRVQTMRVPDTSALTVETLTIQAWLRAQGLVVVATQVNAVLRRAVGGSPAAAPPCDLLVADSAGRVFVVELKNGYHDTRATPDSPRAVPPWDTAVGGPAASAPPGAAVWQDNLLVAQAQAAVNVAIFAAVDGLVVHGAFVLIVNGLELAAYVPPPWMYARGRMEPLLGAIAGEPVVAAWSALDLARAHAVDWHMGLRGDLPPVTGGDDDERPIVVRRGRGKNMITEEGGAAGVGAAAPARRVTRARAKAQQTSARRRHAAPPVQRRRTRAAASRAGPGSRRERAARGRRPAGRRRAGARTRGVAPSSGSDTPSESDDSVDAMDVEVAAAAPVTPPRASPLHASSGSEDALADAADAGDKRRHYAFKHSPEREPAASFLGMRALFTRISERAAGFSRRGRSAAAVGR